MRWEDERYVRFYTRDTPEFLALSWHARGLLGLIMRKVDRAGILPVGKLGLRGVAVVVGGPWTEVEGPLRELIDDGCVRFEEESARVVLPNFLDAQEAKQSDAARKRASRERARDGAREEDSVGYIYVVRSAGTGQIKIGFSTAWESRLRGMATDHGSVLDPLLVIVGRPSEERELHARFAALRTHGEWFSPGAEILTMVSARSAEDVRKVTIGHAVVTDSHERSRTVTNGHDESLLTVPNRAEPDCGSARDGEPASDPGPDLIAFATELAAEEQKQCKKGIGTSVSERVAAGGLPTPGQKSTLRKIYDSRVTRTGAIPLSTDEQWTSERWREARRRLKLPDGEPERRHVVALWEKAAKSSASAQDANGWKPTAREIVAHWIKSYLSDGQSHAGGIVDQKHPIAILVARAGETYGMPPKPQRKPPASAPSVAEPPAERLPPSSDMKALLDETIAKIGGSAPRVKRPSAP